MITLLQDGKFLHNLLLFRMLTTFCRHHYCTFLLLFRAPKKFFIDRLDGNQLFTYLMRSQIDFPECTPSQDSTDPVELAGSRGRLAELAEINLYQLLQLGQILRVRRHIRVRCQRLVGQLLFLQKILIAG
jgi:hypothetical protein